MHTRWLVLLCLWALSGPSSAAPTPVPVYESTQDCVVLLHGLRRSAWAMSHLQDALTEAGYQVYNEDYPSTSEPVEALAADTIPRALKWCDAHSQGRTHFVTHSMGGILVRAWLQTQSVPRLGRIVMLSPPNQGSEVVDHIGHWWLFEKLMGPAGQQLGTGNNGIAASLAPIPGEIGVITGRRSVDPWLSWMIPGEDDGKVSLKSATLPEMKDFLVVPASHSFIMRKSAVIDQVRFFLQQGHFAITADPLS